MKKKNFFLAHKQFTFFLILALLIILGAIFAPVVTGGADPLNGSLTEALEAPSRAHIFGTDKMGRDIFTRIIYGARAVDPPDLNFPHRILLSVKNGMTGRSYRFFVVFLISSGCVKPSARPRPLPDRIPALRRNSGRPWSPRRASARRW